MIYWTSENFSEPHDFELTAISFFYYVLLKIAFSKHRILKIDNATSTGNHANYILDSFGLRWRQHMIIGDLHGYCTAAAFTDSTNTVLIPRIKLCSSARTFPSNCAKGDFRSKKNLPWISITFRARRFNMLKYIQHHLFPPMASCLQHCTDPLHLTTSPLLLAY